MNTQFISNPVSFFNSEDFTQIKPFNINNILNPQVQSDHVEIGFKTASDNIVKIWNISNPAYHCNFQYGANPPFKNSHLFFDKKEANWMKEPSLVAKIDNQISCIANDFVAGKVNVQVIVEGFTSFYTALTEKIKSLGKTEFRLISLLNNNPEKWGPTWNVTGILIDNSRFEVLGGNVFSADYLESLDGNKKKHMDIPYAHLREKNSEGKVFVIAGLHIPGCDSQYPKTGLETVGLKLKSLQISCGGSDVIAVGDFNTSPKNARESLIKPLNMDTKAELLVAPYPTHVNTNSQAANYDQLTILKGYNGSSYEMLSRFSLSASNLALVTSIEDSRQKFLADSIV